MARLERDGAHVVGMTGMPEAVLARELEIPYAAILVVANHAAGRGNSTHGIHMEAIEATLKQALSDVQELQRRFRNVAIHDKGERYNTELLEAIELEVLELLRRFLPEHFPERRFEVGREGRMYKIRGDLSLGEV